MKTYTRIVLFALVLLPRIVYPATYTVVNTNASGGGSLQQAILDANANAGADTIAFNITNASLTISPASALPNLSDPVTIDGSTQPGFSSAPIVEVSGASAGANANGFTIAASDCVIRALVINGFDGDGIRLDSSSSNSVYGNYIGVDATGTYAIPNGEHGVNIQYGNFNLIGGAAAGQSNLISGNLVHGVNLGGYGESSFTYSGTPPPLLDGNIIQGNLIGTDSTGQSAIPNQQDGVFIGNMRGNLVGGYEAGERNVISGNLGHGVEIVSSNTESNQVAGNFIGITLTGTLPLGNSQNGVYIDADNGMVGATNAGAGNIIAFNGNHGVQIGYRVGNLILGNSIYANTNLGIDLGGDGVTLNDPGDSDTGANDFQNYPVLTRAVTNATETLVTGSLNSGNNLTYRVELFDNPTNDPGGYGEGQTYLGFINVTTDGSGDVSFMFTNSAVLPLGHYITATATDPDGNTSEFSFARKIVSPNSLDLAVTIAESADPLPHFTNFTYTVTATNYGPTNATGVFVTNTLSPGLTFVSAVPTQGSASQSAGVVTWNVGALADGAGASVVITVHGTVTALESNSVVAIAAELENDSSNNSAVETTSFGIADLAALILDSPDPVAAGQTVTYTIIATNLGPDSASGSTLEFYLPGGSVPTGAAVSQGTVSQFGNYFSCSFGTINANASATLTVTAIPTLVGFSFSTAIAAALEFEPDTGNNGYVESAEAQAGAGILAFASATYGAGENAGSALITVQRLGGDIGTVAVDFATSNLTAIAGSDYTATNGTLVFTNSETSKSFAVAITNDLLVECNEDLRLRLFNPTGGAVLLPPTNATLQILEDDITPSGLLQAASLKLLATGNGGFCDIGFVTISDDGRYVAFASIANNLVTTSDGNADCDVFLYDRVAGPNVLISVNTAGSSTGNKYSRSPSLSADGQRVAFFSMAANLTTNSANLFQQIYVRTVASGVSELVSVSTNGGPGNNHSYPWTLTNPTLSTNGAKIAFVSGANNLFPGDNNGTLDVYVRDLSVGTNVLVSVNLAGNGPGDSISASPAITADGNFVAFTSYASNLVANDFNNSKDIYRRDLIAGITELVSVDVAGTSPGNTNSDDTIFISAEGRYIAFQSRAINLTTDSVPTNQASVYLRDMAAGTTILVSKNNQGTAANDDASLSGMSRDGRYVLFETAAINLAANDIFFSVDVFVRDTLAGTTTLVSENLAANATGNGSSYQAAISPDGRYVSFISFATNLVAAGKIYNGPDVFVRDLQTGITRLLTTRYGDTNGGNNAGNFPVVSTNGVTALVSFASDLVPLDINAANDVFARDAGTGPLELMSGSPGVTGSGYSYDHRLSADGTKLAFASYASDLVTDDTNFNLDVFLHDLAAGSTTVVSVNAAGTASAAGYSENPSLSGDGRYVTYQGSAQDIAGNDSNGFTDVYLRDTVAGTNALISVNQTGTGAGNDASINGRITPDGRSIVFESRASNLVSNDVNGATSDIFIRTRTNNFTQLISLNAAGTASANSDSYNPRVSPDGRYVVYVTFSSNLGLADSNNHYDIYARDRLNASNILCSPNLAANNGGNEDSFGPIISDDGNTVVFFSYATNLVAGDTNGLGDVFAFDLTTRTMKLVSATPAGVPGSGDSYGPSVSANGRYVAFQSDSTNLVANTDVNGNSADVFVRDLAATTTTLVSLNCAGMGAGNEASYSPQISADGRYVVFTSAASDIVPGVFVQYSPNVFRRDLQTGTTILISQNRFATGAGNASSDSALVSSDGSVVSFLSDASDLVAHDDNHSFDVFAWNSGVVATAVDLVLIKTASTAVTGACYNLTYTLAVTNIGTAAATGVNVTDTLPAGMVFVSASATQGGVTNSGGTVTASVGNLNIGAGAQVSIIVTANAAGNITNTAIATANEAEATPANNTSSVVVTVTPLVPPPLTVTATNGNQLLIAWPSATPNVFFVQTTTNLTPAIIWTTVTNAISDNGTMKSVLLNVNLNDKARFYRLHKP